MAFGPLISHLDKNDNIWYVFMSYRILHIQVNVICKSVDTHAMKNSSETGKGSRPWSQLYSNYIGQQVKLMKAKPDLSI